MQLIDGARFIERIVKPSEGLAGPKNPEWTTGAKVDHSRAANKFDAIKPKEVEIPN